MALCVLWPLACHAPESSLRVSFFAVGQGDCALVRAGRTAILIDFGPPGPGGAPGSSRFSRSVLPYLRATRCSVGASVLTHPHADHLGGLEDALRCFPHMAVLTRQSFVLGAGDVAVGGNGITLDLATLLTGLRHETALAFPVGAAAGPGGDETQLRIELFWAEGLPESMDANEHSVITRAYLSVGGSQGGHPRATLPVLLAADAGTEAEQSLLAWYSGKLSAAVLKTAHHGSNGSSSPGFIAAVRPLLAIVSVGPNRFGHPGADAMARLAAGGRRVLRTDRDGWVEVSLGRDAIEWRAFCVSP